MEAGIAIAVKRALTPQKGGFLASGFTHTLNPYVGCAFGRVGCPFCYVRESPVGQFGPAAWGTWVRQKVNIAEVLEQELHKPAARRYRVFMASATDPYQPAEARAALTQRCLAVLHAHPIDWLVVQTRSLLVQRDFALLAELPFATLNVPHVWGWMLCLPTPASLAGSRAARSTPRSLGVACSPYWDLSGSCRRRWVLAPSLRSFKLQVLSATGSKSAGGLRNRRSSG